MHGAATWRFQLLLRLVVNPREEFAQLSAPQRV
ncbi:hypothetical protein [Salinibacter phage 4_17]